MGYKVRDVKKVIYKENARVILSKDFVGEEVAHMVLEGREVWKTMVKLWKENIMSREVKRELYERVVVPTVVYGSETWSLSTQERRK